jgi:aminopeptidase N
VTSPRPKYRKDYRPPRHRVEHIDLRFDLDPAATRVTSRLKLRRHPDADPGPLELDGEHLELERVTLDGKALPTSRYRVEHGKLIIPDFPEAAELETEVAIAPDRNTALSGLYASGGTLCTQCEAEGFRRITFFPDRPDVMATYTTTLVADRSRFPVLLSNGNRVEESEEPDGRHRVRWEDPFPKPSYLFALVAGDLRAHTGSFRTRSGRDVRLEIWVEPENIEKCDHALESLKKAMKWDEDRFGREYDLDLYMIVAVNDFNMGAMENKGLNVFNSKYVLAKPETATDDDYEGIEGVVAHEYFHNWTGNRVTCRDWFQLTLKEGLTVFRDQSFTADMHSASVKRIHDVRMLRGSQFDEDAGPMAHPVRPESYIEMNNFYTSTVYLKGAEVVRLYETLLGRDGFRKGMDLYFERHDGQAVTCDDFRRAMADANGVDLDPLERWYAQAGTPQITSTTRWNEPEGWFEVELTQSRKDLPGQGAYEPMPIPIRTALLSPEGSEIPLRMEGDDGAPTERTLVLERDRQTFRFHDVRQRPVASLLRGFSAPVRLVTDDDDETLAFRFARDTDPFNRWDAGQMLAEKVLLEAIAAVRRGETPIIGEAFVEAYGRLLTDRDGDPSWRALAMQLPSERMLAQQLTPVDPAAIHVAREAVRRTLAARFEPELVATWERPPAGDDVSARRLRNAALGALSALGREDVLDRAESQFTSATNMTEAQAALHVMCDHATPHRERALAAFHQRWKSEPLVIDKWFMAQAISRAPDVLDRVEALAEHPDFSLSNPNRARSLLTAFAMANPTGFHDASGRGYRWIADHVLELDARNPQVAARLVSAFNAYARFEPKRQALMRAELQRIADREPSRDVYEIVSRALGAATSTAG